MVKPTYVIRYVKVHSNNKMQLEKVINNWRSIIIFSSIEHFGLISLLNFNFQIFSISVIFAKVLFYMTNLLQTSDIFKQYRISNKSKYCPTLSLGIWITVFLASPILLQLLVINIYSQYSFSCCSSFSAYKYSHLDMPNYKRLLKNRNRTFPIGRYFTSKLGFV